MPLPNILITLFLIAAPVLASASEVYLPQTGQTTSYAAGDDGAVRAGVPWPSPRFTDNGDGTVTDTLTALMWLRDANCFGSQSWPGVLDTVADFNANPGGYACQNLSVAYNDWRVPNINELATFWTVLPGGTSFPDWLQSQGFARVQTGYYMSSTPVVGNPFYPWGMYFGYNSYISTSGGNYLWPVRGTSTGPAQVWRTGAEKCYALYGQECVCGDPACPSGQDGQLKTGAPWPDPRLVDNQNGTVSDNLTGLMWLKDANCIATNYPGFDADDVAGDGMVTWQHALDFVAGMNSGSYPLCSKGFQDWRLSNVKELHSLIDFSQGSSYPSPALPAGHPFSGVDANSYFHASTAQNMSAPILWSAGGMWVYGSPSSPYLVWPVRTERSYSTADLIVSKQSDPDTVPRGQQVTYTVRVRNNGPSHAAGVTLADTLPAATTFVSATPSQGTCNHAGGVVNCAVGTINVGASATVSIVATAPGTKGSITNSATVSATTPDHDNSNNTASAQTIVKAVWYVDGSRPASGNGMSWGQAFKTIPEALTASAAGDQIWVKEGAHVLSATIDVNKAISLYGGFAGDETSLAQRDWKTHITTVDGNNTVLCLKISAGAAVDGFTVTNCRNTATWPDENGGGILITSSSVAVFNCSITNSSTQNGGGGGIGTKFGLSSITITDSIITGNSSPYYGGGIYVTAPNSAVRRCVISGNTSGTNGGGGIYVETGSGTGTVIADSVIAGNSTLRQGGGVMAVGVVPAFITNCLIYDNQAAETAAGVAIYGYDYTHQHVIQNSAIVNNRMSAQGYSQGSAVGFGQSTVTVTNSIIWGNKLYDGSHSYQIMLFAGGYIAPTYSDIQDSYWGALTGSHNINLDPRFRAPAAGDFRLQPDSPCIDRGTHTPPSPLPATDIAGAPRIMDGDGNGTAIIDMGPYERSADASPPSGTVTINGGALFVNATGVILTLTADDPSQPIEMCISNSSGSPCAGVWKEIASPEPWTLDPAGGDGTKTVYVWLRDGEGNTRPTALSDTITLDTAAPTDGTLTRTEGNGEISLSWFGFSDGPGSGITSYRLASSAAGAPANCDGAMLLPHTTTTHPDTGLTNGMTYHYRLCAVDNAGNVSAGVTVQGIPGEGPVMIGTNPYGSIQEAYLAAQEGDVLRVRGTDLIEGLVFNRPISVVIEGGYDPTYTSNSFSSVLYGDITVTAGTVTISGLIIQGTLTVTGGTVVIDGLVVQ